MQDLAAVKEALRLALEHVEQAERNQAKLQRHLRELVTARSVVPARHETHKLAYTFKEGMALLSIPHSSAYRALNAGEVETHTHGRRRYITHDALMAFLGLLKGAQSQRSRALKPIGSETRKSQT